MGIGPLLLCVLLIVVLWWGPGWLLGEALGVRRILLPVVAPLLGMGVLTVIGVMGNALGLSWQLLPVVLVLLLLSAVLFVARLALQRRFPDKFDNPPAKSIFGKHHFKGTWVVILAGLVAGGAVAAVSWTVGTEGLLGINQDWDIPWHANMIRLISVNHEWDPSIAGNFAYYDTNIAEAPIRSYPIAFHAVLSLFWPMSGVSIPVFLNVFVLVMMGVQLPLSTMALTMVVTRRPLAVAAAGAVSGWFTVYPYDLLWRGPLIPFFAGMLLVGPFVYLAVKGAVDRRKFWIPGIAFGAVGLIAVHPSLAFVVLPVLVFWMLSALVRRKGRILGITVYLAVSGVLAVILGLPIITQMLKESERVSKQVWAADTDRNGAIQNIIFLNHGSMAMPILTAMVALGCLALVFRIRMWWYFGPVLAFAFLSVYTMGTDNPRFMSLTAPFYDDQWRIFGILVMLLIPLAGLGVAQVAEAVAWLVGRVRASRSTNREVGSSRRGSTVLTAAVAAAVLLVSGIAAIPYFKQNAERININTKVDGATLSKSEVDLLSTMDRYVPQDATVLNDSCDGSVWMYALGNRMPMIRHFEILPTNRQLLVLQKLGDLASDDAARAAASELGIEWVYIADGRIRAWDEPKPGLTQPDSIPYLKLVVREGNAALYQIDWSQLPGGKQAFDAASKDRLQLDGVSGILENTKPDGIAPLGRIC
ncbi:DUF6541 family protein [Paenarthrobacter ilicis]|uniref:Uncharacterized protein n=1 Tax=Paenarthrobacter ilicis TaxID=43665 RepID=A0ABX0TGN7_9MICC|nr:DUF6541 family protein [Paenarthrobacter ilicis]MBM7793747.1 hypothetical protein [Paenarthrobacter ilicis]NII99926.1 hypothetical protein [Paenarthrobacter ilicis]